MIKSYMKDGKKLFEVFVAERDRTKKLVARRKRNIANERLAKEIEFQFKIELSHVAHAAPIWTWEHWHRECVKRMKAFLQISTLQNYEGRLKKWIPKEWGQREISSFTVGDITDLLDFVAASETPVSQKHILKLVRRIFQMAVDDGLIPRNPTMGIKVKHIEAEKKVLTAKEAEIFLQAAKDTNHRFYSIWAFALKTGMRSGEMYALKWSDVDLEAGIISVTKQWTNKIGFAPTKTRENRVVPISPDLKEFLIELMRDQKSDQDFILPHLVEWTNGEQAQVTRDFCKTIGVTEVKFHDLRATFITNLLSQGVALVKVMAIVGHRKMATTDIYLRLAGVEIKGATDTMGFQLPKVSGGAQVFQFQRR